MSKYLDSNGLLYLWGKIKDKLGGKVDKVDGMGLSANDFTSADKLKLDGLENYTLPAATADTLGGVKVGNGLTVNAGVLSATGGGTADAVEWSNVLNKPDVALKSDLRLPAHGRECGGRCVERGSHRHELRLDRRGLGRFGRDVFH